MTYATLTDALAAGVTPAQLSWAVLTAATTMQPEQRLPLLRAMQQQYQAVKGGQDDRRPLADDAIETE